MRLKRQETILVRIASCVVELAECRGRCVATRVARSVVVAVDLLVEGLGVECVGRAGDAGDDRKRNQWRTGWSS